MIVRMILRQILRRPVRTGLSVLGLAAATALLVGANFIRDSTAQLLAVHYGAIERQDFTLSLTDPRAWGDLSAIRALPGVLEVHPIRTLAVEWVHGPIRERTVLHGIPGEARLHRVLNERLRPVSPPLGGVLLDRALAGRLQIDPGGQLHMRVLEGSQGSYPVEVLGTVQQFLGLRAYMAWDALPQTFDAGATFLGAHVTIDAHQRGAFYEAVQAAPRIEGASERVAARRNMQQTFDESLVTLLVLFTGFSGLLAMRVAYNSARITLSERERELASLRVLGFTRWEVAVMLLSELGVILVLALPLGWGLGYGLAVAMTVAFENELYHVPFVIHPATYAYAGLVVALATGLAGAWMRRRLDRLDLIAVLKRRD